VLSAIFGELLAWIVAVPGPTAVTGTVVVFAPATKLTVAGTVATAVLLELRLMMTPPKGASADSVSVRFCVPPLRVMLGGVNTTVAVTCTDELAGVKPLAVAKMFAVPKLTPVTVGCTAGVVWPVAIVTLGSEMVTLLLSLLASAIVTGAVAGDDKLTGKAAVTPSPSAPFAGRLIVPVPEPLETVTLVAALAIPGVRDTAVMVAVPCPTAVNNTFTVVEFAAKLTLAGTVTTFVLLEVRFTVRPPGGAPAERFRATFCVAIPLIVTVGEAKLMTVAT
jgi:hypothetical protein